MDELKGIFVHLSLCFRYVFSLYLDSLKNHMVKDMWNTL